MVETMSFQQSQNIWMLEVYPDFSRGAIKSLENHYSSFAHSSELKLRVFWAHIFYNLEVRKMAGKLYLLSTGYIPVDLEKERRTVVTQRLVSIQEAKQILGRGFISAVGHEATAKLLAQLLETPVPFNRVQVYLEPGDEAVCFVLKTRLSEGRVLSEEELRQLKFYFVHARILEPQAVYELAAQGIA